jgi:hypothetical protein
MEARTNPENCQLICIPHFAAGKAEVPPESIVRKLRLMIRRSLSARQVNFFKSRTSRLFENIFHLSDKKPKEQARNRSNHSFHNGEIVRVRSKEEIRSTLNIWGILHGCMYIPEMAEYCGTTQRIYKRLERFVDERDYRVHKSNGIYLLEGVYCQGTSDFGRCDRSCFFFWREEWLEKI